MIFPYLLRKLTVTRPKQVWAMDITYIPMAGLRLSCGRRRLLQPEGSGMEIIDYAGNGVLSRGGRGGSCPLWQARDFQHRSGLPVHQHRLHRPAAQERDQDQHGWERCLARQHLRRAPVAGTIKYEEVYLRAYASVQEARASIGRYIDTFYNATRPHSTLDRRTPDEPTSLRCSKSRLQYNHGRNPRSRTQPAVQTNRTSSLKRLQNDLY